MPIDPLGFDAETIMFTPIPSDRLVTYRVQISASAAEYIQQVVTSGQFDERHIVEAGALMYIAHMTGSINILGPEGAEFVREKADQLQDGFDRDAMLATLIELVKTSGLADSAIEMLSQAFPPV